MKKIVLSLGIIAIVAIGAIGATRAYFSDTATSTGNTFTAGTLLLNTNNLTDVAPINLPNMAPGNVSDWYTVTIENNGSIDLAWLGDWQFDGGASNNVDLKNALYIADAKMEFLSPTNTDWLGDTTAGYESNGADWFIKDGVGHGPYPSWYNTLASQSTFGLVSLNKWNNNAGMVPGSVYEHAGALKPHYKYKLSVRFGMAPLSGNDYQGIGPVTAKLKVDATQLIASQISTLTTSWADMTWLNNQIADQTE